LSHLDFALVERELGRASMALNHFFGRPQNILMACEGEQIERYLMPAVCGEKMDALAMTEPEAGSDVRGMKCRAVRDGSDWVINGTKHFISGAEHADFIIVFVATGQDDTPHGPKKRITVQNLPSFAAELDVDLDVPGFGRLQVDTAFGGDSFVIVDANALGFEIAAGEVREMARLGVEITKAGNAQPGFHHPENADWNHISFCLFAGKLQAVGDCTAPCQAAFAIYDGRNIALKV
jgi:alkylation response protein AidB-like acyl-CoA dehydrogenase